MSEINTLYVYAAQTPTNGQNGEILRFKQGDDLNIAVAFFEKSGGLRDLSNVEKIVLEIFDIGGYNSPAPRQSEILLQKVCSQPNKDLQLLQWQNKTAQHAFFELDASQTNFKSGEKWLKFTAICDKQKKFTLCAGWIECEENFCADALYTPPDVEQWKSLAESAAQSAQTNALLAEGYAVGTQNNAESEYKENCAKYFFEKSKNRAENAASFELKAKQYAETASACKSASEEFCQATQNAKTAAISAKEEALNAKTAAQNAANTAAQTDIGQYKMQKANNSFLHIINGEAKTAFTLKPPFTILAKIEKYSGTLFNVGNLKISASTNVITAYNASETPLLSAQINANYINCVAIICTNSELKISANTGVFGFADFEFSSQNNSNFTLGNINQSHGNVADIAVLNFDISTENYPYSFANYVSGKSLPPYLTNLLAKNTDTSMGATSDGGWDITQTTTTAIKRGVWTASATAIYYLKNRTLTESETAQGINNAIDIAGAFIMSGSGCLYSNISVFGYGQVTLKIKFKYRKNNTSVSTTPYSGINIGTMGGHILFLQIKLSDCTDTEWHTYEGTITKTIPKGVQSELSGRIGLSAGSLTGTYTDYAWSIADLELEILGASLALENFTFKNGTTKTIPDKSAQNSNVLVSGYIAGENDTTIERLYNLFK